MSRRVLVALLALTLGLLLFAVVPVGATSAAHDRDGFRATAIADARSLAALAEEDLSDRSASLDLPSRVRDEHDSVEVVDRTGREVLDMGGTAPTQSAVRAALAGRTSVDWRGSGDAEQIVATVPVGDPGEPIAALTLTRSAQPLHERVELLWLRLSGVGVVALLVATFVALALARWAGRPLRTLEQAAVRLGEGALSTRARVDSGPPEARRLADTFNAMAGRLEALIHGSRAVVADVSHQLRTPLAALRLRLELLAGDSNAEAADELAAALAETERLSRIVDGLLAVARAEHADSTPEPVALKEILDTRVDVWRPLADERNVVLVDAVDGDPVAATTAGTLEQVLDNLLANSLDALCDGGHVRVTASAVDQRRVRVVVADDGPGMSPEQRESAFLRFSSTRADVGGAGLGLAIVHRLVTADGGDVHLDDTPGGGLTVVIDLPAP